MKIQKIRVSPRTKKWHHVSLFEKVLSLTLDATPMESKKTSEETYERNAIFSDGVKLWLRLGLRPFRLALAG